MPEWCHKFDFTSSQHNWTIYNSPTRPYVRFELGSGYDDTSLDPGIILIERVLLQPAVITSLKLIASTPCPSGGTWRFELISGSTTVPLAGGYGENTFIRTNPSGWENIDKIRVALDTNRSGPSNPAWPGFLHTIELHGTGENPFLPNTLVTQTEEIKVICSLDTLGLCSEARVSDLVVVNGSSLSKAACEDWFAVEAGLGRKLTYQEIFGLLLYTEFDTIRTSSDPKASTVYALVKEALARQYYEIAGTTGRFSTPEALFTFLGGIEGWYGHHSTEMVGDRFPLAWIIEVGRTGAWVESPYVTRTPFRENFVVPAIVDAYQNINYVWDSSSWGGEDWTQGYGNCLQPARWGNVSSLTGISYIEYMPTPGGSTAYPYFVVQPTVGC